MATLVAPFRAKPCKGCETPFVPRTFRLRYCDDCRGECSVEGCTQAIKAHRFCGMHLWRYTEKGDPGPGEKMNVRQFGNCSVEGCELPKKTKGFCSSHYERFRKHGVAGSANISRGKPRGEPCEVVGCTGVGIGDGLCRMHYERRRNTGELGGPEPMRRASGEGSYSNGYRVITVDGESVLEHRHVMSQVLGRPLTDTEVVHHLNGQRDWNDPSNLELWDTSHPPGQRVTDKVAWCIEFLKDHPKVLEDQGYTLRSDDDLFAVVSPETCGEYEDNRKYSRLPH